VRLKDVTIRAYYISYALGILRLRRVACAISQPDLSFRIAKQLEREIELFRKRPVRFFVVKADAKYLGVFIVVLLDSVTESNAFGCSAGGIGFRIEPKYDRAPFEVAQAHVFASVRLHVEIRRLVSYFKHNVRSFDFVCGQLKNSLTASGENVLSLIALLYFLWSCRMI
jgi:hypothetical protein